MIKLNKKGVDLSKGMILGLVLAIIILVILLLIIKGGQDISESVTHKTACIKSVRDNALSHVRGFDISAFGESITCPTLYLNFSGSADKIERDIANIMVDSWDVYGKGKLNLFSQEDGTYCAVYAVISSPKKVKILNFDNFLENEKVPLKRVSYAQYLLGASNINDASKLKENIDLPPMNLDLSDDYAVVFYYTKNFSIIKQLYAASQTTPGHVSTVAGGLGTTALGTAGTIIFGKTILTLGLIETGSVVGAVKGIPTAVVGGLIIAGGVLWNVAAYSGGTALVITPDTTKWFASVNLIKYNSKELDRLGCQTIGVAQKRTH